MRVIEDWPQYVRRVAVGLTQAQIAERTGAAPSNVGRWLRGERGQPTASNVLAFARAFDQPIMEAMVAAGYFTPEEAESTARTPLSAYSKLELLDELRRREGSSR
jgi:transcriptional regulator with XRE-family HTH domain